MSRWVSRLRSLSGALLIGLSAPALVIASGASLTACGGNENDPMTHVKRLEEPSKRAKAVDSLIQMFNHRLGQAEARLGDTDGGSREGVFKDPEVSGLLDKIVEPLAQIYMSGEIKEEELEGMQPGSQEEVRR